VLTNDRALDFGLLYELTVPNPAEPGSESRAYWDAIEEIRCAERVGFTHAWAVEHHFLKQFSHSSAPEVFLSAVAQHTSEIRIGHGVVLLPHPFNHPVRVAERAAALDILSRGRLELGTGRSITEAELGGFTIDTGDSRPMWEESIRLIPRLWTEDTVSHQGRYLEMPPRCVLPKPVQRPHPPLWLACSSPATFEVAGCYGLGALGFGMAVSPEAFGRRVRAYRDALSRAEPVGRAVNDNVAVFLMAACAPTKEKARAISEASFEYYMDTTMRFFLNWGSKSEPPPGYEWYAEVSRKGEDMARRMKWDFLYENDMIVAGDPDHVCEVIQKFADAGVTQILMATTVGTITHEQAMATIKLVGEAVIPQFRGRGEEPCRSASYRRTRT